MTRIFCDICKEEIRQPWTGAQVTEKTGCISHMTVTAAVAFEPNKGDLCGKCLALALKKMAAEVERTEKEGRPVPQPKS
jgi:hypothetical protein